MTSTAEPAQGNHLRDQPTRRAAEHRCAARVYGADHDRPGARPDRCYAELLGGLLEGVLPYSELPDCGVTLGR